MAPKTNIDMQTRWMWIAALFGLVACSPKGPGEDTGGLDLSGIELPVHQVHTAGELKGKVEPWLLERDTTYVRLSDYFPNTMSIDSVVIQGAQYQVRSDGTVKIVGGPKRNGMYNMEIHYDGHRYDVPLFASTKVPYRLDYKPSSPDVKTVQLAGNFNGWNPASLNMNPVRDFFRHRFYLRPGVYQYQVVEDGKWMLDAGNPNVMDNGQGGQNSFIEVGNAFMGTPMIYADSVLQNGLVVKAELRMDSIMVYWENQRIEGVQLNDTTFVVTVPKAAQQLNRSHLRMWACRGINMSNDLLIPLDKGQVVTSADQLSRKDRQSMIMYFAMVDRFHDGDASNNEPVDDPSILPKANHLGGDLAGITQKINDGYFDQLGMNTIWISPITQNAEGAWGLWDEGITSKFSGYHGYWPVSSSKVDRHFGDEAALNTLIETAHAHDMNVVLDYVANHVHQNHPVYQQNKNWATDLYLPDGTLNTEKWDEHRLTTWFDTFLPTLDFGNPEVVEAMTDSAMFWVTNYDLDGFRHDATKHIDLAFWQALTNKMKAQSSDGTLPFQIGETYGGSELIRSYMGSGLLDSQFDFNLYDAAVAAFATDATDKWDELRYQMKESMVWYGFHNLMGNMTGNQDRPRYISLADGGVQFGEDTKLAGWTREINNRGPIGYQRSKDLMVFLMTAPGIPCVYYGDEIGMPGGNDPDNRRMMQFDGLNAQQQDLRDFVADLANMRQQHLVFQYGDTHILPHDEDFLITFRKYLDEEVLIVFAKGGEKIVRERPWQYVDLAEWESKWGGTLINAGNNLEITLPEGQHFEIFFRKN